MGHNKNLTEEQELVWKKLSTLPKPKLDTDGNDGHHVGFFYCPYIPIVKTEIAFMVNDNVS